MKIGVLGLQGDFLEHVNMLENLGIEAVDVRLPAQIRGLDGIILPGGESTTIGKLADAYGLLDELREFGQKHAIWGTCAGAILLAKNIHRSQPLIGLMDIVIARNAFGRQVDSFISELEVAELAEPGKENPPFPAVFIRAPIIESVSGNARVLAALPEGQVVAVRQDKLLATSFHPELTGDHRFHRYFINMVSS